jgi:crossover junction endodeoxyribonuclease RuvC
MKTVYIGIDPGISGAVAILDDQGAYLEAWEFPLLQDGKKRQINAAELAKELGRYSEYHMVAIVERVGARPGQGVASMFNFGKSYGMALGVVAALGAEMHLVTPPTWKKHYKLTGKPKDASRTLAQQYYPAASLGRKKDHGKGDALLLARYGQVSER